MSSQNADLVEPINYYTPINPLTLGGYFMDQLEDKLEYAARFGLRNAAGNLTKAENIAQAKFRDLVGRALSYGEEQELRLLTKEIEAVQQQGHQGIPSVVGFR